MFHCLDKLLYECIYLLPEGASIKRNQTPGFLGSPMTTSSICFNSAGLNKTNSFFEFWAGVFFNVFFDFEVLFDFIIYFLF